MKKTIIGTDNCQNCAMLKNMVPGVDFIELNPMDFLPFCRAVGIQTVPFVIVTGTPQELGKLLEDKDV